MTLSARTRLGSFEIVSAIGAGGMGEVYRARDLKLNRDVALKVLPEAFTRDPDRLARFRREAVVLASLNDPHIAAIHGFEDSGQTHALVLELVEGETLADRIARGPIPLEDALPIARQICAALEAAHEQGIIHRDLKPANIKVTHDGAVKVLDFGLAKLSSATPPTGAAGRDAAALSPTITSPAITGIGVLLGTAAYMSPEQARGREADRRSDMWSFGCVLYEMLTGRRPFDGQDTTDVLGAVVRLEPAWTILPPGLPEPIRALLQGCLVKDRRARIGDIAAARFVLDRLPDAAVATSASAAPSLHRPAWQRIAALTSGALVLAILSGTAVWYTTRPTPAPVIRTVIKTSGQSTLVRQGSDRSLAIAHDGSRVVYRGNNRLLVRALDQLEPVVLSGLGPAPRGVFLSPDGGWIGFVDGNVLKKVAITGGPPVRLCADEGAPRGATWGTDRTIIFATTSPASGLLRVSDAGGEPTVLTKPDRERGEHDHLWPEFLPGGRSVLFTITAAVSDITNAQIAVLDLRTLTSKVLISGGSDAHYVPTGHLIYGAAGTLRAVGFDLERLEVKGTPTGVLEGVATSRVGGAEVAFAANGSLVYVPGSAGLDDQLTVVSVDREGRASPLPGLSSGPYRDLRVSPDGARLAVATQVNLSIYDLARATLTQPTTEPSARSPLWAPDGRRLIFSSSRSGYPELYWRPADGSGNDELLLARGNNLTSLRANDWSADGKHLLFTEVGAKPSIGQIAIDRRSEVKPLIAGDSPAAISPDGAWIAYENTALGRPQIYVERYPQLGSRQPISTTGGRLPVWSRSGRELFFSSLDGRQILTVPIVLGTTLVAGQPKPLFDVALPPILGGSRPYDLAPDGRFLMIRRNQDDTGGGTSPEIVVVQNWFEELKRLVPVK